MSETRLMRSETDKVIAGVCGGLAAYLGVDPVFVRLAFAILLFASGIGFPMYIILWIVMPAQTDDLGIRTVDEIKESGDISGEPPDGIGKPGTVGIILIMLGAYFLIVRTGMMGVIGSGVFWAIVLVGVGIFLFSKSKT